ncbi:MAG: lipocalin-like domain-containing protein [Bacteroidaceae bacterium]|nr:lipocalin-like domain-containing protein [Bacteroidaceae bacterium]
MKGIKLFSIVSLVLFFALSSCQKADDNGDLGGYWKLMQVEYLGTDSIVNHKENSHFMAVQLDLMQFTALGVSHYARFVHKGNSLNISMIGADAPKKLLSAFGFNGQEQHFYVNKLTDKRLIIESFSSKLTFKKF